MKSIFPSKITAVSWDSEPTCTVHPTDKDDRLELTQDWLFIVYGKLSAISIHPRKGFRFEGSVPRPFWRVITPTDPAAWSAFCIHDFCYLLVKRGLIEREQADELLFLALRKNGYNWFTATAIYRSVRIFGGTYASTPITASEAAELAAAGF